MEYHFVPQEERARDEKGNLLPWGYVYQDETRNPRRPPEESGPFGRRRNARYDHARSRTRTGTPAKKENPNVAEFGRLFAQQQEEDKTAHANLPKSSSSSNLEGSRKPVEKIATECILYGYKNKEIEWKVIDKYERISQGFICEDYPRSDPSVSNKFSQLLSGGDVVIRSNLSAEANRKSKRYAGGLHWIKVTFDSTTAADRACFFSPQEVDGHLVFCELYHGQGPAEDIPIPKESSEATRTRSKAHHTLTSSHSAAFLQSREPERSTLPRSFAMNNLSAVSDIDEGDSQLSTATASSATATAVEQPPAIRQRSVPETTTEPKPESEYMTHIPSVRRAVLRPVNEALPPQPTLIERVIRSIPIVSWFTGDIVGDGPQFGDDGVFDYGKSNFYWRFWYMIDQVLGTDICGLKEDSGKGTPRRKTKRVHKTSTTDDKKLQATLKKMNVQPIQAIEEVNMFKEDGNVIHFSNPKVHAAVPSNTFAIYGNGEEKELTELVPGILNQLGPDSLASLRKLAESYQSLQKKEGEGKKDDEDEDDIPDLVEGENFEGTVE